MSVPFRFLYQIPWKVFLCFSLLKQPVPSVKPTALPVRLVFFLDQMSDPSFEPPFGFLLLSFFGFQIPGGNGSFCFHNVLVGPSLTLWLFLPPPPRDFFFCQATVFSFSPPLLISLYFFHPFSYVFHFFSFFLHDDLWLAVPFNPFCTTSHLEEFPPPFVFSHPPTSA